MRIFTFNMKNPKSNALAISTITIFLKAVRMVLPETVVAVAFLRFKVSLNSMENMKS